MTDQDELKKAEAALRQVERQLDQRFKAGVAALMKQGYTKTEAQAMVRQRSDAWDVLTT